MAGGRITSLAWLAMACAATWACDDPPLSPVTDSGIADATFDIQGGEVRGAADVIAADSGPADGANQPTDGGAADAVLDAAHDAVTAKDVPPRPIDVVKPDVPSVPLEVVKTVPADGASGVPWKLSFEVHFSAPLLDASIAEYTVFVKGPGDQTIEGDLKVDGKKFTFTAAKPVAPASRVLIELNTLVQSHKGDTLAEPFQFRLYTAGYADTADHAALAARYAPTLLQGIGKSGAQFDRLRSPGYDQDFDGGNNVGNLGKFDALARVGWAVVESHSHFFIHYAFYWPRRVATTPDLSFDNDVGGATVVVARYPKEQPVALLTWFKNQFDEQMWAWTTQESGLVPKGAKPSAANVRQVLPLASLFPTAPDKGDTFGCDGINDCTPRRYPGYLTAGSHQSCMWLDGGDNTYKQCQTDKWTKKDLKVIRYRPGAVATKATGAGVSPDGSPPTFIYELEPLFEGWFPHREEAGKGGLFAAPISFVYKAPPGRPPGAGTPLATKFISVATADFGRPPWAWQWKPGTFTTYYKMPLGTPFMDPAWALFQRLGGTAAGVTKFTAATKKGLSMDYCFQPFLFIDQRGTPPCTGSLPTP